MMGKILTAYIFLAARLREPSTNAALTGVFLSIGFEYPTGLVQNWLVGLGIVFGLMGVFVKEGKAETEVK